MILQILVLAALIRLLLIAGKPFLCSGIYAGMNLLFGFFSNDGFPTVLLSTALVFALSSIYFWLLDYMEYSTARWWIVAVVGLLIGLV